MKRPMKAVFLAIMTVGLVCGCFFNALDSGWDFDRDSGGNLVVADTARMWQDIRGSIDRQIDRELSGFQLPESWKDYWERRLSRFSGHATEQKFQAYIVCIRRGFHLPPLSDEWEDRFDDRWCEYFDATEGRYTRGLPEFAKDNAK